LTDIQFAGDEPENDRNERYTLIDELPMNSQEHIIWCFEFMKKRFELFEKRYEHVDVRHERLREDMKSHFDRTLALSAGMFFAVAGGFIVLLIQM